METNLYEIMKKAGIFMVLAQAIIQFRPNPAYEKYLRFLAGIMSVVILVFPIWETFHNGAILRYGTYLEEYQTELKKVAEEGLKIENTPESSYLYTMQEEVKSRLNNLGEIEGYVVESAEIWEIPADESKGTSAECHVEITLKPDEMGISTIEVDKVKLEGEQAEGQEAKEKDGELQRIRESIAKELELEEGCVEVDIID